MASRRRRYLSVRHSRASSTQARVKLPISPGSKGPNEQMLLQYYQGRISYEELFPPEDEPGPGAGTSTREELGGVDTSKIQSYQIREFVESLEGLREDLRLASASERTMKLALTGPVSPVALAGVVATHVAEGTRTPTAGGFQLVEILNCIDETSTLPNAEAWGTYRQDATAEVLGLLEDLRRQHPNDLGKRTSFARYESKIRRL